MLPDVFLILSLDVKVLARLLVLDCTADEAILMDADIGVPGVAPMLVLRIFCWVVLEIPSGVSCLLTWGVRRELACKQGDGAAESRAGGSASRKKTAPPPLLLEGPLKLFALPPTFSLSRPFFLDRSRWCRGFCSSRLVL